MKKSHLYSRNRSKTLIYAALKECQENLDGIASGLATDRVGVTSLVFEKFNGWYRFHWHEGVLHVTKAAFESALRMGQRMGVAVYYW